jgi:predicted deacylase
MTGPTAGRSLSGQSLVRGKKVLVAEAGRSGVVAPADIKLLVDGSLNVLGSLHMIARPVQPVAHPVWLASDPRGSVRADSGGAFFATVARDTRVKQGQIVGYTTDYLGRKTGDVKAPVDGLITFIRGVPSMSPRATLVTVLPIVKEPAPYKAP